MKWILEPNKRIKIIFEPWGKELELTAVYKGKKKREEKIWGRRRWLVMEKIIPISKSFKIKLLGFGMPQFLIADLGTMKMTIGFTSWSSNDWVKGTAFNIMAGFIGKGTKEVYNLLKDKRNLTLDEINENLKDYNVKENKAGVGMLLRKGEAYFDPINDKVRFRQLCNIPIPKELYEITEMEKQVEKNLDASLDDYKLKLTDALELIASNSYNIPNPRYRNYSYYRTPDYDRKFNRSKTEITLDQDGQIIKVSCDCKEFKKGPRNISAPCSHILALYMTSSKFTYADLKPNVDYNIKKLFEELL